MTDALPHLDETVVATARFLGTLSDLTDEDVRAPSLLPGWTRAHVITHVARNADALCNVLHGAQAGELRAMYASQEQRDADVEAGAPRGAAALRADAVSACGRWVQAANEVHHADLGLGYTALEWPAAFVSHLMKRRHRELTDDGVAVRWRADDTGETWATGDGPEVTGLAADLVWWLLGRGAGEGLACSDGQLPDIGRWR